MHDCGDGVDESEHVDRQLLVDLLEVVDVAEPEQRVDAHTRQQWVDLPRIIGTLQIGRDDACAGLSEAHAQQAGDLLYGGLEQARLVVADLFVALRRVLEVQLGQRVLRHRLHHVDHALNRVDDHALGVVGEHHRAADEHDRDEDGEVDAVLGLLPQQVVVAVDHAGAVGAAVVQPGALDDGGITQGADVGLVVDDGVCAQRGRHLQVRHHAVVVGRGQPAHRGVHQRDLRLHRDVQVLVEDADHVCGEVRSVVLGRVDEHRDDNQQDQDHDDHSLRRALRQLHAQLTLSLRVQLALLLYVFVVDGAHAHQLHQLLVLSLSRAALRGDTVQTHQTHQSD